MTVIAWDGQTLAADRLAAVGGCTVASTKKIFSISGGRHVGIAGMHCAGAMIVDWLDKKGDVDDFPLTDPTVCTVIVVNDKGELFQYDGPVPCKLDAPFHAIGSGRDFAMTAMYLGKDACQAVEIASELSQECGNGMDFVTVPIKETIH